MRLLFVLLAFATIGTVPSLAQQVAPAAGAPAAADPDQASFSLITGREAVTSLAGKWRFQPGDDPRYAEPGFDDSHWKLLDSTKSWTVQGYKGLSGVVWYRFRVVLPAGEEPYVLFLTQILTSYQVFVDGALRQTVGRMPPTKITYTPRSVVVPLPISRPQQTTVMIALRVWRSPLQSESLQGGPTGESEVGSNSIIERRLETEGLDNRWDSSMQIDLGVLQMLACAIAFSLYLLGRSQREYFWFGMVALMGGVDYLTWAWSMNATYPVEYFAMFGGFVSAVYLLASLAFYRHLLRGRADLLFRIAVACIVVDYPAYWTLWFLSLRLPASGAISLLVDVPAYLWIVLLLIKRFRERLPDAQLLIFPALIQIGLDVFNRSGALARGSGSYAEQVATSTPFLITYEDLAELCFLLAMLAILIHRFARTRREQERAATELEAARTLQHVLIPEAIPTVPGLEIATAYHPAREVGGDFFQVAPLASGDTLVVLGDVSGKGMAAAMTVSLLVGCIRTLLENTDSPAEMLAGLNRRLCGRGSGFTTCLALRVSPHGLLTVANAGHLPPYRNGEEIATEPALPLGVDADAVYREETVVAGPGDRITLLTDGVPEATRERELFGFARTQRMSREPAAAIAQAARDYGQADDITVLSIDVLPPAGAELATA